jgi:plasmid stabilization system protein ParE
MRVRWTTDAADDLERICDYTRDRLPLRFNSLRFINEVFESQGEVRVLRILHGAQQWPPG